MATSSAVREEPATRFPEDQLKSIIERIERPGKEKRTISGDLEAFAS